MSIQLNGVYLIENVASGKNLNIYGIDQVGNNRNVCQYTLSADLSQLWLVYGTQATMKLASVIKDNQNRVYTLNVYRNTHKNCDIYQQSTANDPDSAVVFEATETNGRYRIRLKNAETDGSYLYLTSIGTANGSSATTSTSVGNVVWKPLGANLATQKWDFRYLTDYPGGSFDIRKWAAQIFLRVFYNSNIAIDAKASTTLCRELTRALQMALGIADANGTFGPTTTNLCPTITVGGSVSGPIIRILCHAMYCKGYNARAIYESYNSNVAAGINSFLGDAGLPQNGTVTPMVFKALLNTDSLALSSSGDAVIRAIQQNLNAILGQAHGIIPTDGMYERNTNRYLIRALQYFEGLSLENTTGAMLNNTKLHCPTIPYDNVAVSFNNQRYSDSEIAKFTKLYQQALYCNGYTFDGISESWSQAVADKTRQLQQFHRINKTGTATLETWCALLTSRGDDMRPAEACDTRFEITEQHIRTLKANDITIVGRYINGTDFKILRDDEVYRILDSGMGLFPIYQDVARSISDFTLDKAHNDAVTAIQQAYHFRLPRDTVIYFAVDFDAVDAQVTSHILPYFEKIHSTVFTEGYFRVGIYGARNICSRVCARGYAVSSFVSDMSYGFSGNLGYPLPENWNYDQIKNITLNEGLPTELEIDRVVYGHKIPPVYHPLGSEFPRIEAAVADFRAWLGTQVPGLQWPVGSLGYGETISAVKVGKVTVSLSMKTKYDFSEAGEGQVLQKANWTISNGTFVADSTTHINEVASVVSQWNIPELANFNMHEAIRHIGLTVNTGLITMAVGVNQGKTYISFTSSTEPVSNLYHNPLSLSVTLKFEFDLDENQSIQIQCAEIGTILVFNWQAGVSLALLIVLVLGLGGGLGVLAPAAFQALIRILDILGITYILR